MQKLMLLCAALAIIASAISVNLWMERRSDQELIAELRVSLAKAEQRGVSAVTAAAQPAPQTRLVQAADTTSDSAKTPTNSPTGAVQTRMRDSEQLKDPEFRQARLAKLRLTVSKDYPGLVEEMALSSEEADKVWNLIAESELDKRANAPVVTMEMDARARQEARQIRQEIERKLTDSLTALLGGSRYQQYENYLETRPGRQRAANLAEVVASFGERLDATQMRNLTTTLINDERQIRPSGGGVFVTGTQADSTRRVTDDAARYLNARQLEILRGALEQQIDRNAPGVR